MSLAGLLTPPFYLFRFPVFKLKRIFVYSSAFCFVYSPVCRILSEYLGEDQMLAVVCRSFAAAVALEKYEHNGEVDSRHALYAAAAKLGRSINGRFLVIGLEDIR